MESTSYYKCNKQTAKGGKKSLKYRSWANSKHALLEEHHLGLLRAGYIWQGVSNLTSFKCLVEYQPGADSNKHGCNKHGFLPETRISSVCLFLEFYLPSPPETQDQTIITP